MRAIKIIAADPAFTETQLSNWRTAAALSHPHLIRLLDSGRSQLKGHPFLFVVMEYAEQSLSQILPHRALTADETREMLLPTLDALVFLHHQNLVHGAIKPSNLLVVNDQLKISSDTIRPAGELTTRVAKSSLYDPPEAKSGRIERRRRHLGPRRNPGGGPHAAPARVVRRVRYSDAARESSSGVRRDRPSLPESQPRRSSHGRRPRSRDERGAGTRRFDSCQSRFLQFRFLNLPWRLPPARPLHAMSRSSSACSCPSPRRSS